MLSNESLRPPVYSRSNSQASVDSTSMEDFWCEVENIKENTEERQDEQTLLEIKPPDDMSQIFTTIQKAKEYPTENLSWEAIPKNQESEEDNGEALLSTLTRTQAAAVQKRYTTYSQTMRKKNKHIIRDVRDIFGIHNSSPTFETLPVLPVTTSSIDFSVQNPDWKMVSSSDCMEYELNKDSQMEKDELSLEISFSESITVVPKHRDCHKSQRLKKDDSSLPKYTIRKSRLGLTEVGDLSPEDMKKIRYLSLIELTAVYDALGIELKRNRTERMKRRVLLENDQKKFPGIKVPLIFQKLLLKLEETGLETEGILRVPGSASRVKSLRQEIEAKFDEDVFDWDQVRNNDAAGLLKMFVRELPKISKIKLQLQALHLLIMLLPNASRDAAKALLQFLKKVVANENKNKMTLWNVSMIVAPNLFIYKGKHANQEEMLAAATTAHVVRLLIKYQDILWIVPTFLITQVRKMNEAAMNNTKKQLMFDKGVRKLLRRKTMDRERPERTESDIPEGVIRVHAPLHSKVSMAIQPNNQTKAKDIVARFYCENRQVEADQWDSSLDSREHCLDPDAYMLDVYRANPQAEWVIKEKRSSTF
ncbi:hypothetical protein Chor_002959 [Crotalus horridus]